MSQLWLHGELEVEDEEDEDGIITLVTGSSSSSKPPRITPLTLGVGTSPPELDEDDEGGSGYSSSRLWCQCIT